MCPAARAPAATTASGADARRAARRRRGAPGSARARPSMPEGYARPSALRRSPHDRARARRSHSDHRPRGQPHRSAAVDQDHVARVSWPKALNGAVPRAAARTSPEGVPDALIAEPGFSALVRIQKGDRERTILFDTGVSPGGMVENMRRLDVAPGDVEVLVLSHGHWEHVTGVEGLARALGRTHLPVTLPPDFWGRRRIRSPALAPAELPATSRSALEGMGFEIVEDRRPSFLLEG